VAAIHKAVGDQLTCLYVDPPAPGSRWSASAIERGQSERARSLTFRAESDGSRVITRQPAAFLPQQTPKPRRIERARHLLRHAGDGLNRIAL